MNNTNINFSNEILIKFSTPMQPLKSFPLREVISEVNITGNVQHVNKYREARQIDKMVKPIQKPEKEKISNI